MFMSQRNHKLLYGERSHSHVCTETFGSQGKHPSMIYASTNCILQPVIAFYFIFGTRGGHPSLENQGRKKTTTGYHRLL